MRKRERRINKQLHLIGTDKAGSGWAARQASKRHNNGRRVARKRSAAI